MTRKGLLSLRIALSASLLSLIKRQAVGSSTAADKPFAPLADTANKTLRRLQQNRGVHTILPRSRQLIGPYFIAQ
jgi:hypothetical protein